MPTYNAPNSSAIFCVPTHQTPEFPVVTPRAAPSNKEQHPFSSVRLSAHQTTRIPAATPAKPDNAPDASPSIRASLRRTSKISVVTSSSLTAPGKAPDSLTSTRLPRRQTSNTLAAAIPESNNPPDSSPLLHGSVETLRRPTAEKTVNKTPENAPSLFSLALKGSWGRRSDGVFYVRIGRQCVQSALGGEFSLARNSLNSSSYLHRHASPSAARILSPTLGLLNVTRCTKRKRSKPSASGYTSILHIASPKKIRLISLCFLHYQNMREIIPI